MTRPFTRYKVTRVREITETFELEALDEASARSIAGEVEGGPAIDIGLVGEIKFVTDVTIRHIEEIGPGRKERWTMARVSKKDPKLGLLNYEFNADLRGCFPGESNHEITNLLKKHKVADSTTQCDPEYSCSWFSFNAYRDCAAFLARLNKFYRSTHQK